MVRLFIQALGNHTKQKAELSKRPVRHKKNYKTCQYNLDEVPSGSPLQVTTKKWSATKFTLIKNFSVFVAINNKKFGETK